MRTLSILCFPSPMTLDWMRRSKMLPRLRARLSQEDVRLSPVFWDGSINGLIQDPPVLVRWSYHLGRRSGWTSDDDVRLRQMVNREDLTQTQAFAMRQQAQGRTRHLSASSASVIEFCARSGHTLIYRDRLVLPGDDPRSFSREPTDAQFQALWDTLHPHMRSLRA